MTESEIESTTSAPAEPLSATPTELVTGTAALTVDDDGADTTAQVGSESASAKTNPKRLHISNVSYQTTEDDLKELLQDFEM